MKNIKIIFGIIITMLLIIPNTAYAAKKCESLNTEKKCSQRNDCDWDEEKSKCYTMDCDYLFGEDTATGKYVHDIYNIIKFAVPILLLGLSIKDFGKAVIAQNDNGIKKATKNFSTRLIISVLILVLPTILNFFLDLMGISTCSF